MEDHPSSQLILPGDFDPELLKQAEAWSPEVKARVMKRAQERISQKRKPWYCNRGRSCDGKPHEGYEHKHARGTQWPPAGTSWFLWWISSGRGWGKSRTGAEWTRSITKYVPRIALIGRRGDDLRSTMVEGDSGLIVACENAGMEYDWKPALKEFRFGNGALAKGFSAEEPANLRGFQHGAVWGDEPAHWEQPEDVWDNMLFGLRVAGMPGGAKVVMTTTPLPTEFVTTRMEEEGTVVTRGSTYENLDNMDPGLKTRVLARYEGTRIGRQELYGEVLTDVVGALWSNEMIEYEDVDHTDLIRTVVSVDPAGSKKKRADDTGIIVVGVDDREVGYVLADHSGKHSPDEWASTAIDLAVEYEATIVAEKNFGGDMVKNTIELTLKTPKYAGVVVNVKVTHASRAKEVRADPIVGLYEQHRVKHKLGADLSKLEKEQTEWVPGVSKKSPNRIDALVHGMLELIKSVGVASIATPSRRRLGGRTGNTLPPQFGRRSA